MKVSKLTKQKLEVDAQIMTANKKFNELMQAIAAKTKYISEMDLRFRDQEKTILKLKKSVNETDTVKGCLLKAAKIIKNAMFHN